MCIRDRPSTLPLAKPVDTTNRHNGAPSELVLANQDRPQLIQQSQSLAANTKTVPVYKWGLRFDGQGGQSVGAFLERVEEIRRARRVTHEELFKSAVDLFAGQALVWYRSVSYTHLDVYKRQTSVHFRLQIHSCGH